MRKKFINLKKYPIKKAKETMLRLLNFIRSKGYSIQLYFFLPYYKKKNLVVYKIRYEKCPYCGSKLKDTENGYKCSGDKLRAMWNELRFLHSLYGETTEFFLTTKLYRFYEMFLKEGRLRCDYVYGLEENRFKKIS